MRLRTAGLIAILGSSFLAGCSTSAGDGSSAANHPGPEKTVQTFLEAVRTGDDKTAGQMLTPMALQRTTEMEMVVAPPGSETASFKVGDVELVEEEDAAHVSCTWSDVDDQGQTQTDSIVWILRHEEQGWRIAGMGTKLFEDQPPLFINFEDPEDMVRKQQLAEQEIERRARGENTPAGGADGEERQAQQQSPVGETRKQ